MVSHPMVQMWKHVYCSVTVRLLNGCQARCTYLLVYCCIVVLFCTYSKNHIYFFLTDWLTLILELDRTAKMFLIYMDVLFHSTRVLCFNKRAPFVLFNPFILCGFNVSSVILMLRILFNVLWVHGFNPNAGNISADKVLPMLKLENRALYITVTWCTLGLKLLGVYSSAKEAVMWSVWSVCFVSQNHRIAEVGRDLWRSPGPAHLPNHLVLVDQDYFGFRISPR